MSYPSNFLNAATNYWCSKQSTHTPPLSSPPSNLPPFPSLNSNYLSSYTPPLSSYPPPSSNCPPPFINPPLLTFYPPPSTYKTQPSYFLPPPPLPSPYPLPPPSPSSLSGIINKAGDFWSSWNNREEEENKGGEWTVEREGSVERGGGKMRVECLEIGGEEKIGDREEGGYGWKGEGKKEGDNKELADFIWGFGVGDFGRSRSDSEISFVTNDESLSQNKVRKAKKKIRKSSGKETERRDSAFLARKLLAIAKNWGDISKNLNEETQRIFKEKMQNYIRKRILPEIQQRSLPSSPLPPPPSSLPPSNDDWIMNEMAPGFFPNENSELRMPSSPLLPTILSPVLEMESSGKVLKTFRFEEDEIRE